MLDLYEKKRKEKGFRGGNEGECRANAGATEATDKLLLDMSARRARARLEQNCWSLLWCRWMRAVQSRAQPRKEAAQELTQSQWQYWSWLGTHSKTHTASDANTIIMSERDTTRETQRETDTMRGSQTDRQTDRRTDRNSVIRTKVGVLGSGQGASKWQNQPCTSARAAGHTVGGIESSRHKTGS